MKCNQNIRLVGNNVVLVPYKISHVPKYHSWMQNPELRELTASEPLSLEEEYDMQDKWVRDEDKCTFIILAKQRLDECQNETDSMIGDVNLFLLKDEDDDQQSSVIGELEIMIAESSWRGRGLGREAAIMMILYGMDHLHSRKFRVKIGSKNAASLNLFEKLGFRRVKYSEVFDEVTLVFDSDKDIETGKLFRETCHFIVEPLQGEKSEI